PHCKAPHEPGVMERALGLHSPLYSAVGCSQCNNTGYRGRTGIYELLPIDESVRQLVHQDNAEEAILAVARSHVRSIRDDGLQRVQDGVTTLEEVLRVTQED